MAKTIDAYTVEELRELIVKKQESEVAALKEKIKDAKGVLADLERQLSKLTGKESSSGSRVPVKETVDAYLAKNKNVRAKEIATAHGLKLGSVNQYLIKAKKDGLVTSPERGVYSLKK